MNENQELNRNELIELIRSCFPVDPVPEEVVADQSDVLNGKSGTCETVLAAKAFAGKKWPEITYSYLEGKFNGYPHEIFFFLNDKSFLYYFPAYLLMGFDETESDPYDGEEAVESVCWFLSEKYSQRYAVNLSSDQSTVIAKCLKYFSRHYRHRWPRDYAMEAYEKGYWRQFDPAPPDQKITPAKP